MIMMDDSIAKLKMSYAITFFTKKLENYQRISTKDKLICVENIKTLFGKTLSEDQIPFAMTDISKQQFIEKDVSKSKLLINEDLERYGIAVTGKTFSNIVQTPDFRKKLYPGSKLSAGEYAETLTNRYRILLSDKKVSKQRYDITSMIDKPSFIHPKFGEIINRTILDGGSSINGTSVFIHYQNYKKKNKIMHLYHLNPLPQSHVFFIDYSSSLPAVDYINKNQYLKLLNDGIGIYTNKKYAKQLELWNTDTNQFDFSDLKLGDEVLIRFDLYVTTFFENQEINLIADIGCLPDGDGGYKMQFYKNIIKNKGKHNISSCLNLYIGNTDILKKPSEILFSSDNEATVKFNGFYLSVKVNN